MNTEMDETQQENDYDVQKNKKKHWVVETKQEGERVKLKKQEWKNKKKILIKKNN